ncbi:MAG: Glu-tRNA(Gln) amidotransferase subunit GatE [Candidatus Aenigmarchaeota archaeon]|nr:Glu-tRNA(Gln) amidotransferase subunit GatE [Candidatus Aenigmarchaeota archaeon]
MINMLDYDKIGLKCGVEIHQQLDTKKLFCGCASESQEEPKAEIRRRLRAVAGELGEVDVAALHEVFRAKEFHYKIYTDASCLVEMDCEPPHQMNRDALEIGLTAAAMLNCEIPDEIHVMRKQVIDGSNTTGFQRTAIVGLKGFLLTQKSRVGISNVSIEEEACQILATEEKSVTYGLDRLSIPLVEIGTSPDIRHPEQAKEVCQAIGMLLRSTGKVRRGIGTIRQDINISVRGGARIEIKGAQELRLIPNLVEKEVERQLSLIRIMNDLKEKGFNHVKHEGTNVTQIFGNSTSKITSGKTTYAIKIPGLAGFLKRKLTPTRTMGNELANYARVKAGVKGIIHTDEDLEKYQLSPEFQKLSDSMRTGPNDLLIIAAGDSDSCRRAMRTVADRINQLLSGVPEETRKALENGDSEYMRPLPGSARMYPETDIPPIPLDPGKLREIRKNLPELIEEKISRFSKQYRIQEELARQVIQSGMADTFEKGVKILIEPVLVASTLTSTLTYLRRESVPVEKLTEGHFLEIFRALAHKKFSKEKLPEILRLQAENPALGIEKILEKAGAEALQMDELRHIVRDIVSNNQQALSLANPEKALMGLVMEKVRGKISGKLVAEVLKEEIDKSQK